MPLHVSSTCAHRPVHGTATYKCGDSRCCIIQFWPPDEHMYSKHVEEWNKLITKFSASSWLILRYILDISVQPLAGFKNSFALEIRLLRLQLFTNSHFLFLIFAVTYRFVNRLFSENSLSIRAVFTTIIKTLGLLLLSSPWTPPRPIFNISAPYPDKRPSHYAVNTHCYHLR
jgi:hypothetical protein